MVAIRFDAVSCQVWIDPLAADATQLLCQQHADRLSPPRGWVVVDRRGGQTVIVSTEEPPDAKAAPAPRKPARRWGQLDVPRLEFTGSEDVVVQESPVEESVVEAETTPEPESVLEPVPEPEDFEALLAPKGGLLGRAFGATGDQKSALTHLASDS